MNTMNKNKNKDGNVHSQAKTRHKTYDPTTRLPRASLLVKAGEEAPGSMGESAEAGLTSRLPVVNTTPPGFWFSQSPLNAQFLALLPFAPHSLTPTNTSSQHAPLYLQSVLHL